MVIFLKDNNIRSKRHFYKLFMNKIKLYYTNSDSLPLPWKILLSVVLSVRLRVHKLLLSLNLFTTSTTGSDTSY